MTTLIMTTLLAVAAVAAQPFLAQDSGPARVRNYRIEKREAQVVIDGKLDEDVWSTVDSVSEFVQTEPDEGAPASEPTKVRLFYDAQALYIGFRCLDSEPGKITTRIDARDQVRSSDRVAVLLDTFYSKRDGYDFTVTSRGVQSDTLISESSGGGLDFDSNWNAIWQSSALIDEEGYTVEIRIPFSSIRLDPDRSVWGLNLQRSIQRKNEVDYWQPVRRADFTMRPSRSGLLTGLDGIDPQRKIDYIPYVASTIRSIQAVPEGGGATGRRTRFRPNFGLDVKVPISSSLVADLTFNPDFGQTEADVEDVSNSRFEVFFPEKREFFTEAADVFRTPTQLFFSRRLGQRLADGSEQRIVGGVRLTGRKGGFRLGLLEAVTERRAFLDPATGHELVAPSANFFVLRVQRNILQKSTIGVITVNRDQSRESLFDPARAHGVDLNLATGLNVTWSSQIAFSQNPPQADRVRDPSGETFRKFSPWLSRALTSRFRYDSNKWEFGFNVRDIGEGFNVSQIGFSPITNRLSFGGSVEYKPLIERGVFKQLFVEASVGRERNHQGDLETRDVGGRIRIQFENFWSISFFTDSSSERFFRFFEERDPGSGIVVRRRFDGASEDLLGNPLPQLETLYDTGGWGMSFRTSNSGNYSYEVRYREGPFIDFGDNFAGRTRSLLVETEARIGDKLRLDLSASIIRDFLPGGELQETRGLVLMRTVYQFSSDSRIRSLMQYNIAARRLSLNTLFFRQFTSRSGFGIGYDDSFSTEGGFAPLDRRVFFKMSRLF